MDIFCLWPVVYMKNVIVFWNTPYLWKVYFRTLWRTYANVSTPKYVYKTLMYVDNVFMRKYAHICKKAGRRSRSKMRQKTFFSIVSCQDYWLWVQGHKWSTVFTKMLYFGVHLHANLSIAMVTLGIFPIKRPCVRSFDRPAIQRSSLHWLILPFLYAFFVQWSVFPTKLNSYPISYPPTPHYISA